MQFTVKMEWEQEDGTVGMIELGRIESGAPQSAVDVGLKLSDTKPILSQIQKVVTSIQLRKYCESLRRCPGCRKHRNIKDYRERRLHTVFGKVVMRAPRFERCEACEQGGLCSWPCWFCSDEVTQWCSLGGWPT